MDQSQEEYDVDELFNDEYEVIAQFPRNKVAHRKWEELGSPRDTLAPMIRQSELAFRMLVRNHGVQLCYTPMVKAKELLECKTDAERH
jgi:tRNA-dihydrouridine synthase 1